jgi:hypothetical protein
MADDDAKDIVVLSHSQLLNLGCIVVRMGACAILSSEFHDAKEIVVLSQVHHLNNGNDNDCNNNYDYDDTNNNDT